MILSAGLVSQIFRQMCRKFEGILTYGENFRCKMAENMQVRRCLRHRRESCDVTPKKGADYSDI